MSAKYLVGVRKSDHKKAMMNMDDIVWTMWAGSWPTIAQEFDLSDQFQSAESAKQFYDLLPNEPL